MTHRERILAAINHEPVDRIPTDYWGVGEVTAGLQQLLGVKSTMELFKAMDIDKIMTVQPEYLARDRPDVWGVEYRTVSHPNGAGTYAEPVRFPLQDCQTIQEIEAVYTFPSTDMFDYSVIPEQIKQYEGYAIEGGYISLSYFYEVIRGVEAMCMDFAADPEIADYIIFRIQEFLYEHVKKILEAADGKVDITQVTDDFGCQSGLMFSAEMIDRYFGKYYDTNIALVRSYGAKVFHHDDGAIMDIIPWLMKKGIDILNPLQWHLPGWDLPKLKGQYGNRLCFHGAIDNQHVLPFGTAEELRNEVFACCEQLAADGTGYILAPCHNVQAITPAEKVMEMYRLAGEFKLP
jgi:uroporphyrinogen decarboxylase